MSEISWAAFGAVALGGAMGALTRFAIGEGVRLATPFAGWVAVLVSNFAGTLLLGGLGAAVASGTWTPPSPLVWAALATGYCGALTTYSAFALDTVLLWYEGRRGLAAGQVLATLVAGLIAIELILLGWGSA